jgi:hypothetical protein
MDTRRTALRNARLGTTSPISHDHGTTLPLLSTTVLRYRQWYDGQSSGPVAAFKGAWAARKDWR